MARNYVDPVLERAMLREESLVIACGFCHEPVGYPCRNTTNGEELEHMPAHNQRLREARG